MNSNKKPPIANKPQPPQGISQSRMGSTVKSVVTAPRVKHLVAPHVYHPQARPTAAQPKMANGVVTRRPPIAPPVYRPQPLPRVMQTKMAITHHAHPRIGVLPAATSMAKPIGNGAVQRFKLKDYSDYKGVLAGDPGITPEKVREMVKLLKDGKKLPGKIQIARTKLMRRKGPMSKNWDEFDSRKDDEKKAEKFWVVTDGHHRFVAYVEAGMDPLAHTQEGGEAVFAYSWNECSNIEEEL